MIAALSRVMDDPIGSLPYGVEFPLGRVFGCWGDFAQDEVPYVESSKLHPFVVVPGHSSLALFHPLHSFISHLVDQIQIIVEFLVVPLLFVHHDLDVRQSYFH